MEMQIEVELESKYLVDFKYDPGTQDHFSSQFGNWLPGDGPEIKILKVCLTHKTDSFDVTKYLTSEQLEDIERACLKEVKANEE